MATRTRIALIIAVVLSSTAVLAVGVVKLAPKATHIKEEYRHHGRAIIAETKQIASECEARLARPRAEGDALTKVLKDEYGYDESKGDKINLETGEITWHVDGPKPPAPIPAAHPPDMGKADAGAPKQDGGAR